MFEVIALADDRFLVSGTDTLGSQGSIVLDGSQWVEILDHQRLHAAEAEFDTAVSDFYAPILEATEGLLTATAPVVDELFHVVLHEEQPAAEGNAGVAIKLTRDSAILRHLADDPYGPRLIWVTPELLEIRAA